MPTVSVTFDISGFKDEIGAVQDDVSQAMRPAAQAGAQFLYKEVQTNVAKIGKVSGNLAKAIYQAYSKDNSTQGMVQTYHVSWNAVKAPHGHLVEYGHVQKYVTFIDKRTGKWVTDKSKKHANPKVIGARPFIRPAMAKFPEAEAAMERVFLGTLERFK